MSEKHAGGRPKGTFRGDGIKVREIMERQGCSRAWAYILFKREQAQKAQNRKELMTTR